MNNYFVVFYAENESNIPCNDVIKYSEEVKSVQDIRNIEEIIERKWFNDRRIIVLINYKILGGELK